MRLKFSSCLFLINLLYFINSISKLQIEQSGDVSADLDNKLNDLFNYYKHLMKNTDSENKGNFMKSLENKAESLLKTNTEDNFFIQTSSKIKTSDIENQNSNIFFSYQPFLWTEFITKNEPPSERRGHSSVLADTFLVIFGGCYMDSKCYNDVYFLDLVTHQWSLIVTTGKIPSARQGHTAVLYGSIMWIYGGASTDGYLNDLYSFNLETREWKQHFFIGAKKSGRSGHGCIIDNDSKLVVFGGYSDMGYLNDVFVINIINERFENILTTGLPPSPRENFSMIFINNRIFIFGGFQEGGVLNDLFSIDVITWNWIKVETQGPVPPPRQGMASARVGKKIYFTGGCDYRAKLCFTDTFYLDIDSLWWTKIENNKPDFTGRSSFVMDFMRGHLYTFGGCEMYVQCFKNVMIMNINDICPNKCSTKGDCKELIGCLCNPGFTGHDCSRQIKCKEDCNNNGICHNNAKCGCYPGWSGIVCNTMIGCPRNCTDSSNGICQQDSTCKCKPGFEGLDCSDFTTIGNDAVVKDPFKLLTSIKGNEIKQDLVKSNFTESKLISCQNNCSNHGTCNNMTGICICEELYSGQDCSINKILPPPKPQRKEPPPVQEKSDNTTDKDEPEKDDDSDKNSTKKEEVNYFTVGPKNEIYFRTNDCESNCMKRGVCLNSTCFCDQGFSDFDCSKTYKQYLEQGIKFSNMLIYIIIVFVISMFTTLAYLIHKSNQKISGDNLDLDKLED